MITIDEFDNWSPDQPLSQHVVDLQENQKNF